METSLGPYVLGGLSPDEEAEVQRHLEDCVECRVALSEVAWIPSWLSKVPPEEVARLITEQPPVERGLGTLATEGRVQKRRRNRLRAAAAVTATATVLAVGIMTDLSDDPGAVTAGSTIQSIDQQTQVTATLSMTPQGAKTGLRLNLTGVAPGERCSLVARSQDGRTEVTATWVATYRGTADIPATTTIPADRLRGFDVVTADGRVLVRLAVPHR
ncbi:zf-HC2 domain-containing protein [Kribbella sancticallisti]